MKQKIFSLLVLMITTVCGAWAQSHTHAFANGDSWIRTANFHFHPCTESSCPLHNYSDNPADQALFDATRAALTSEEATAFGYGVHDYSSGVCIVCGKHTHDFATAWTTTATHHYHKCTVSGCPLNADDLTAADVAAVTLTADEATDLAFAEHVISDGYCTSCGYDEGAGHVHVLDGYVQKTTYHYMKCTVSGCPYYGENVSQDVLTTATTTVQGVIGYGSHSDLSPEDGNCDVCGYAIPAADHVHVGGAWVSMIDGTHHYQRCTVTNCSFNSDALTLEAFASDADAVTQLNYGEHDFSANSGNAAVCAVCGGKNTAHTHVAATDWTIKDTYHYKQCTVTGCTFNGADVAQSAFTADASAATDLSYAEHTSPCATCGYGVIPGHVHEYSSDWSYTDGTGHYHKCIHDDEPTCEFHDGYTSLTSDLQTLVSFAAHIDESPADGNCDVCGYAIPAHVHVFGDWSETTDKQYHYKECSAPGCTITDYTNMSDLQKAETSYGKHQYGTSQEGTAYYTCKICGIENATRKAETHTHSYMWASIPTGTGATDDDPEHWQQCTSTVGACIADQPEAGDGPRKVPAEKKHQFVTTATDYTYYTCSVCGYIDEEKKATVPHGHVIDTETWASNDAAHYHECIGQGNCDITNYNSLPTSVTAAQATAIAYAEHTYGTSQQGAKYYTCQVCEYISETRRTEAHTHNYGEWQHDNVQHWKECSEAAGPCDAPKGSLGNHVYGTSGDARWTCSTCSFVNTARQAAILNAETAMNVQSWSWDYEIPFNFEAPVQNDRRFNANQCYTVILPYALELNGMKAYTIEQHNDKIVGFKEQAVTELPQLTPYILKSEATGNPLSMPMTTIYSTLLKSDNASDVAAWMTQAEKDALLDDRATVGNQPSINNGTSPLSMIGTLKYLKAEAVGLYILQGKDADHPNGVFKKVETAGGYDATGDNRASVLPMRAYLKATTSGPARLLSVVFYAADGSVTAVERLALDEDGLAVIYDLQGRRVQNPRKGGLYIINGRKSILK